MFSAFHVSADFYPLRNNQPHDQIGPFSSDFQPGCQYHIYFFYEKKKIKNE